MASIAIAGANANAIYGLRLLKVQGYLFAGASLAKCNEYWVIIASLTDYKGVYQAEVSRKRCICGVSLGPSRVFVFNLVWPTGVTIHKAWCAESTLGLDSRVNIGSTPDLQNLLAWDTKLQFLHLGPVCSLLDWLACAPECSYQL